MEKLVFLIMAAEIAAVAIIVFVALIIWYAVANKKKNSYKYNKEQVPLE